MKKNIALFLAAAIVILIIPYYGYSAPSSQKKVIMCILDNVNYEDLTTYGQDNIKYILENGALGLMNTNSGGSYTVANAYATIGAGSYAVSSAYGSYAGEYDDLFYNEPINTVYKRNTGKEMKQGNIANIDILGLKRQNEKLKRPVKIGLLGSLLNEHGYKTALIGNESTSLDDITRNASLITMSSDGITDFGKVDQSLLIKDFMSPFGITTNYDALYQAYKDVEEKADFIVIQTGDTYRLNKYMYISDERHKESKTDIFKDVDEFLGKIIKDIDSDTLLMLVTPFPSGDDIAIGKKLTPVIVLNESIPKGVLTSATTKRDGIITNTDLTAHIVDYFGITKSPFMIGHKLISKNMDKPLEYLTKINEITAFNYKIRSTVVKAYIGCIIAILLMFLIFITYFKEHLHYIKPLLIAVLITPTVLLVLPILNPWSTIKLALSLIVSVLTLSLIIAYFLKDNLQIFIVTCLTSTGIILLDTFLKNPLMKVSILGYDPIVGARFYGIGNEYMGFLLGTAIVGTAALIDRYRNNQNTIKILSIATYVVILLTLMAPTFGTNVGGSMAAFIGFGAAAILNLKGKITKKDLIVLACFLIIGLFALFIYDGMRPSQLQSHIGQTSSLIKHSSFIALFQIFWRKLSMNYKLIRYSTWTWVLFATMATLGILFKWPVGILKEIFRKHNYLYFGFISGIIGTLAALAFNDSGVVAAAMFMIPITIPLIMMCIDEEIASQKNSSQKQA
ncbi:conserved membrane protein of unknown function [Tepidanaerobacter acetatoxydans Re1]|uniref:Uncharacterized protein n=1 Tax=Tepidanaerobacter acetatoxydans (strain DSM 21804 / JCM 16047 / Re1) TaxID=1209989 RepID=F4LQQ4_TEPAE|nr:hypothetical protein [Tepidanaerobacter acetatoxydans]AEE92057.1 hypothetical protein TepRe1_1929 [Tepidanaerobacter acetatoxydans Re1]CDI40886.1 conserved membrane protein of unknown function [Tepidanaerobacter acetatoxydans Re1]